MPSLARLCGSSATSFSDVDLHNVFPDRSVHTGPRGVCERHGGNGSFNHVLGTRFVQVLSDAAARDLPVEIDRRCYRFRGIAFHFRKAWELFGLHQFGKLLVLLFGCSRLDCLWEGHHFGLGEPFETCFLNILPSLNGLVHRMDQRANLQVGGSLDVLVVTVVHHRRDELGMVAVDPRHQQHLGTHNVHLETSSSKSTQVLGERNNGSSNLLGELLESNGQVIKMNHGSARLHKHLGLLHDRSDASKTHIAVCNHWQQIVVDLELLLLFFGKPQKVRLLSSVMETLGLEQV
ncbi:hypothetical protein OGAPHI_006347 [Ogataea philodendri]|uniref:Uncharacterized protein n=1 Tax=Ogataea philodendri TaxID=1378263 RepID=A0A9P8NXC4_9ASCO|nr:uncharacterized protein OGAPHI_006347 [Ogataea philodendri]KAH3661500.1 hypothetical protein OGAPHI_006347 [Ogataea philodendri]